MQIKRMDVMEHASRLSKTTRQDGVNTNFSSTLSHNENDKIQFGPDPDCHHRHMLANMSCLVEAENLTDMTIQCSDGYYIHTHKKLLSSVSSLARKLSREHGALGENQRLHLIINVSLLSNKFFYPLPIYAPLLRINTTYYFTGNLP